MKPTIPLNIQEKIDSLNNDFQSRILKNENDSGYNLWVTSDFLEIRRYLSSIKPYNIMFLSWNKWSQLLSYWKSPRRLFSLWKWFNDQHNSSHALSMNIWISHEAINAERELYKSDDLLVKNDIWNVEDTTDNQKNTCFDITKIIKSKYSINKLYTVNNSITSLLIICLASTKKVSVNDYWNALIDKRSLYIEKYFWFQENRSVLNSLIRVSHGQSTNRLFALQLWNFYIQDKIISFPEFESIYPKNIASFSVVSPFISD